MDYLARVETVEAERVTLADQELYAVAVDGKAHLVSGDVFTLFFAPAAACPPKPVARPLPKPKPATKPAQEVKSSGGPQARSTELRESALGYLREFGPLTTAELGDRLYPGKADSTGRYQGAWTVLKHLAAEHLVEKRDLAWHVKVS